MRKFTLPEVPYMLISAVQNDFSDLRYIVFYDKMMVVYNLDILVVLMLKNCQYVQVLCNHPLIINYNVLYSTKMAL